RKEDIKVSVRDNVLQISGEKKREEEEKDANYHRIERVYGTFSRTITLPAHVEIGKVEAYFKDGVLRLTLPKAEEEKPRQIEIK
ncbi:MAG: Hsp20/alpha crystallin family protein, partial [candidate division KSB1 bacterium]|nr:Hsp20/alpha crystallin family protein [candidate division KSB1 bacterium]